MSEIFFKIGKLAMALGARNIKDTPGCWSYAFGPWHISVNPHKETTPNLSGLDLLPFHMAVERDGMPLAMVRHDSGTVIGGSEADICAALDAEIARVSG